MGQIARSLSTNCLLLSCLVVIMAGCVSQAELKRLEAESRESKIRAEREKIDKAALLASIEPAKEKISGRAKVVLPDMRRYKELIDFDLKHPDWIERFVAGVGLITAEDLVKVLLKRKLFEQVVLEHRYSPETSTIGDADYLIWYDLEDVRFPHWSITAQGKLGKVIVEFDYKPAWRETVHAWMDSIYAAAKTFESVNARPPLPRQDMPPDRKQKTRKGQPSSSGTGFVISRQGHVLTNNHVIDGCMTIRSTNEGLKQPLTVVTTDPENDLALLKLPAPSPNIARFREGRTIRAGDGVVAVGFPLHGLLAAEANVTTGTVSALAGIGNDTRFLQITVPIQPGNSGGPLLDQGGNIVGVIVSTLNALNMAKATGSLPQNVNFAINGAVAKSFLDANSVEYEVAPSGKKLETSDVGVQAKKFTLLLECFQ